MVPRHEVTIARRAGVLNPAEIDHVRRLFFSPDMFPDRLSNFPYVLVRVGCTLCKRRGQYRLARLAAKFGSELPLEELLDRLAFSCPHARPSSGRRLRKYQVHCGIYLIDLERSPPPPPDLPGPRLVALPGGRDDESKKKAAGAG